MASLPSIPKGLPRKEMIAFAVIGVVVVGGIIGAVLFLQAAPGAPKPAEDQAIDLLTDELAAVQDVNTTELEGLLKLMIS